MNVPKKNTYANYKITQTTFFKTLTGYLVISVLGLTAFYFAKRDITTNRVKNMKIKEEIQNAARSDRYSKKKINETESQN